jgi:glyoxylase-like metal-dependent hydrolase (beta-lactamase superfamily II)
MKSTGTFVLLAVRIITVPLVLCATMMVSALHTIFAAAPPETLHLDVFVGEADSWNVTSTLIYGKSDAILVDSQFRISQANKLADKVAERGRRLKAIIITHPDYEHYMGTAVLHERFPDTPIYMTTPGLEEFKRVSDEDLAAKKASAPSETPDSIPTPEVLPTTIFTVDGETVEVIKDFQGDVLKTANSFLRIPSLRAVIAGDIVFNGVYAYLADSSPESRHAWHDSLQLIAALRPRVVVAGHKKNAGVSDSQQVVGAMEKYLDDFESAKKAASNTDQLVAAMKQKYPDFAGEDLLVFSAKVAFPGTAPK